MSRKRARDDAKIAEDIDLAEELSRDDVATAPSDAADPPSIVQAKIPADIRNLYEIHSYRGAAVILSESRRTEFEEILRALRQFRITKKMIRTAGGNESDIPKLVSNILRPLGWYEAVIQGDLHLRLVWREPVQNPKTGKIKLEKRERTLVRPKYLDGHKVDYVKGKVAFDLEWNSKDQTFDRDLYAFSAFAQCGVIDVAVLVTRSKSLNHVFEKLGPSLKKDGKIELKNDKPRLTKAKFGASTTWMGKLLYRLNAGRNGACPVLAIGITPKCITDWSDDDAT